MRKEKLYAVMEKGNEVFRGTIKEIANKYGLERNGLYNYLNKDFLLLRKYNIVGTGEYKSFGKYKQPKKMMDRKLEYLYKMLTINNNTIFVGKIEKYIEPLKAIGIKIKYKPSVYDENDYIVERTN